MNPKYPRMPYLTVSPAKGDDESRTIKTPSFCHRRVILTTKMDGSNVSLTRERLAARNGSTADHLSFDRLKGMYSTIRWTLPKHLVIFGEWLYAMHSIHYVGDLALEDFLEVFGVLDIQRGMWLNWEDTSAIAKRFQIWTTPVVSAGTFKRGRSIIKWIKDHGRDTIAAGHEGMVIRTEGEFPNAAFHEHVAKYVRIGHVSTDDHWWRRPIVPNEVRT